MNNNCRYTTPEYISDIKAAKQTITNTRIAFSHMFWYI